METKNPIKDQSLLKDAWETYDLFSFNKPYKNKYIIFLHYFFKSILFIPLILVILTLLTIILFTSCVLSDDTPAIIINPDKIKVTKKNWLGFKSEFYVSEEDLEKINKINNNDSN